MPTMKLDEPVSQSYQVAGVTGRVRKERSDKGKPRYARRKSFEVATSEVNPRLRAFMEALAATGEVVKPVRYESAGRAVIVLR